MPDVALTVVDLEGNAKADLEPDALTVRRRWCGTTSLEADLDVRDPRVIEVQEANRALKFRVNGALKFHGKIGEPLVSDKDNVRVTAADPFEELGARKLQTDETYHDGTADAPTGRDVGAIAWDLIDAENSRNDTRIRLGAVEATVDSIGAFTAGTSRADCIEALSKLDGSFGFILDPVDDTPGVIAEFNAVAGFARNDLPGVRFEYGDGTLANCSGFTEELKRPRNRIIVTGASLDDGTRPQAVAEDTASQDEYGLWEYEVSVDSTDTDVLQAHADAELRPEPIALYTMTPNVESPLLFIDFDAGDIVYLRIRHGRVDVTVAARVDEASVKLDNGDLTMDSITLSAPVVPRATRAPDERLYVLLGSTQDRLAALERQKPAGKVFSASVPISSATLLSSSGAGIELVPAPGPGLFIFPSAISVQLLNATTPYSIPFSQLLRICQGNPNVNWWCDINAQITSTTALFVTYTGPILTFVPASGPANLDNAALVLRPNGGVNITGGDGDLIINVQYAVMPIG